MATVASGATTTGVDFGHRGTATVGDTVWLDENEDGSVDEFEEPIAGVEVTLTDFGVECYDVTQAPVADVDLPIEQRQPGGLGLHLIRRLVDSWGYEYRKESWESRITFKKTLAGKPAPANASPTGAA